MFGFPFNGDTMILPNVQKWKTLIQMACIVRKFVELMLNNSRKIGKIHAHGY